MGANTVTLTDANFNDTISGETPILVDFWAAWCGPCRLIAPILEEMATEYQGKISIGKLNVDENPRISANYDVMSIPTLILFKEGQIKGQMVGVNTKAGIVSLIQKGM